MIDDETYYVTVKAVDALGHIIIRRSDGVTIKRDPLIPGQVYDGLLTGQDLTYQVDTTSLSANWNGFGGHQIHENIRHSGKTTLNSVKPVKMHQLKPLKSGIIHCHSSN